MRNFLVIVAILVSTPALADVVPLEQTSPAKGTKSCMIQSEASGDLVADVQRGGGVRLWVVPDTMPGTRVYFMLDGHRYSAVNKAPVPSGPLIKEQPVQFTYTSWPENYDINGEDVLKGFASAYAECRKFMG